MKKVSIISVNYNQPEVTLDMLKSLKDQDYQNLEVIVVDNGSKVDPSLEINDLYPEVITIRSERNLGFAGGNNLGIQRASGDYLFFLNNDTEVPNRTIFSLVEVLDNDPQAGVVCPVLYYYDHPDTVQYAGSTPINYFTGRNSSIGYGEKLSLKQEVRETSFAHGAAMMIRREAIEAAGKMPENYFLYYEELDWISQIKQCGYGIYVNHECRILHKESISTGKKSTLKTYFLTRNRILFMRRNASGWKKLVFTLFFCFISFPKNIFSYLLSGNFAHLMAFFRGVIWNLTHSTDSTTLGGGFSYLVAPANTKSEVRKPRFAYKKILGSAIILLTLLSNGYAQELNTNSINPEVFKVTRLLNSPKTIDSLVTLVHNNSGLIRSLDYEMGMYEEEMLQRSRNWVSAFRFGVNIFSANTALNSENQSLTTYSVLPNLGLTLSVNPESFVNRKSEIRLATNKRDRVSSLQDDHRQRLKIKIINLYYEYLSLLESMVLKQNTLNTRKQHTMVMEVEFKNGTATYDQLLVVQNQVQLMEEDLMTARIETLKKKSEIEVLLGLK